MKILCNHKMNMEYNDIISYINNLKKHNSKAIVFPSAIYIPYFIEKGFDVGIQNIFFDETGSYTGEISAMQAKSVGVKYALIGHSERRRIFGETNDIINQKIKMALKADLKVILCVGENLSDRENFKPIIKKQITEALKGVDKEIIISYEPIWSVGTGLIPSKEEVKEVTDYIKTLFDYNVMIFYGGSVNEQNIMGLKEYTVDGFLVGGASLKADEVIKMEEVIK